MDAVVKETHADYFHIFEFYFVHCSTIEIQPDLVFTINGVKYIVTPQDYIKESGLGKEFCALSIFDATSRGFGAPWVFGSTWISSFCNIYDIGQKRIGFAKPITSAA
ncbi:Inositol hexakisphosphate and diphosphoinositol-pentakisphosphate kinase [Parelaphostrongylus tenuis]|uniref:Inositol hexakisphosphate and diphosphoinositol-pentakisphosphate kinase n=1 Tax=Parelaphostrongylus tenuis TaxID=148309 RepID=A0AAD5R8J8_PARTN|nr:Inositol hexakisphosphate and diphosphoinositol-pentakisphosphate kinase [Parelaphostrongylus tenuis]